MDFTFGEIHLRFCVSGYSTPQYPSYPKKGFFNKQRSELAPISRS